MMQAGSLRPLLLPLVPLYRTGLALREIRLRRGWEPTRRLRFPVISVGNISTGGSGKTPFVIALAKLMGARGFSVDVLSRGYGRQSELPARVRRDGTAQEFGDEPLLIAGQAGVPVYVAPQRFDAGSLAERDLAKERQEGAVTNSSVVHVLDDGFQHRQLARDIDIVLMNREDWHDGLLPAGNLRELHSALRRAHIIAIPAGEPELEGELKAWGWSGAIWHLRRRMEVPAVEGPVAAFCGIARPAQFFDGLEAAGLDLAKRTTFRDHHRYTALDVERLASMARKSGAATLITTDKDLVRLGRLTSGFPAGLTLKTARLQVEIEDEAEARDWIRTHLRASPAVASL